MPRRTSSPDSSQSIPEMGDKLTCQEIATWYKDGKLTPHGREMAKFLGRAFPAEKVDEWGFLLTRKEREAIKRKATERKRLAARSTNTTFPAANCTSQPCPPPSRKRHGKAGRRSCARSSAASRGPRRGGNKQCSRQQYTRG